MDKSRENSKILGGKSRKRKSENYCTHEMWDHRGME